MWIENTAANCVQKGDDPCYFCDLDEAAGGGTYNCFPICDDLGSYFDTALDACVECNDQCRYC